MPSSYQDWTVTDTEQTVYSFNKEFLKLAHIEVWQRPVGGSYTQLDAAGFVASGSSGSGTVTLQPSAPARVTNDTLRIVRNTPSTKAGRVVDFVNGSLSEADLDTSALQQLYVSQENADGLVDCLQLASDDESHWDGESRRIKNLAEPALGSDAARLADVQAAEINSGNLPTTNVSQANHTLQVNDTGSWAAASPSTARDGLGLGSAAVLNEGTGDSDLSDNAANDASYLRQDDNLLSLDSASTARTNLGLGSAATKPAGTNAGDVLELAVTGQLPALDGALLTNLSGQDNRVKLVYSSQLNDGAQALNAVSWTTLSLTSTGTVFGNSGGDVTFNTSTNRFFLTVGLYVLQVELMFEGTGSATALPEWKIRQNVDASASTLYTHPSNKCGPDTSITQATSRVVATAGTVAFDLEGHLAATSDTADFVYGTLTIWKITT